MNLELQLGSKIYLVSNNNSRVLLGHTFFIPNNLTKLGGQFLGLCLFQLVDAGCGFRAHDVASPVTTDLENKIEKV